MKCRIIYKQNGTVSVIHVAPKARRAGETDSAFLKRVAEKAVKGTALEGLPYEDVSPDALPDRKDRDKWRGKKGQGVKVDPSVVTTAEKKEVLVDSLDVELAKPTPDVVKILRIQRKLQRRDYSPLQQ